jgi:hypothetical protein
MSLSGRRSACAVFRRIGRVRSGGISMDSLMRHDERPKHSMTSRHPGFLLLTFIG